jgi:hypothetical protein
MSTLAATNLKHASSASNNIVLDSSGNATFAGTPVPNSSFLRNRIINGDMRIDQRNAGASVSISAYGYGLDRWGYQCSGGGVWSSQRTTVVPAGYVNSLGLTVTTADASIGSTDVYQLFQKVEGFNVSDLGFGTANAQTITVSFWVRSSVTGTYSASLQNNAFNRGYVATFTVNAANTWEYKTLTVTGDTSGTWTTDNSIGMQFAIDLGSGSATNITAGSWQTVTTSALRTSGSVNWIATNGATFYITGVQLEVGTAATPFERRQYGQELALCQRYYEKSYNTNTAPGTSVTSDFAQAIFVATNADTTGGACSGFASFKTKKRAAPTGSYWDLAGNASRVSNDPSINNKTISAGNVMSSLSESGYIYDFVVASAANNRAYWCWSASAEL